MNYLGLDFGQKHLGIALATGSLASPLVTIATSRALDVLPRLIATHQIKGVIIGISEGPVRPSLDEFIHSLKIINCPVYLQEETLSTQDAIKSLLHTSKSKRKFKEHAAAAAIILQSWLDSANSPV